MPVPLGKANGSKTIQRLTAALAAKQLKLEELQQQHDVLCYQHRLLVALCDSLNWLRNRSHEQAQGDPSALAAAAAEQASIKELGLLQQLQGVTYSLRFARLPVQGEEQQPWQGEEPGDTQAIAPPGDMLHLFHKLVLLPPLQNTCTMELKELQADYMGTVRELSLNLYLHRAGRTTAGTSCRSPSPLERMAAVLTRHLHLLSSVSLARRGDLVSAFLLSNCETGEILPAVNKEQHRSVVPHLHLTQQQLQNISAGIPVFKRLLQPVVAELKQLQQEDLWGGMASSSNLLNSNGVGNGSSTACKTLNSANASGDGATTDAAAAAATVEEQPSLRNGRLPAADPDVAESFTHFEALGLQQRRARRLDILLQKEYLIRSYASTYVYGCLSWVQLATLSVLMAPFSPAPAVLVQEIFNAMEQQKQQQDQATWHANDLPTQEQQQQQAPAEKMPRSRNRKKQLVPQQLQDPLHASDGSDEQLQLQQQQQQQQDAAEDQGMGQARSDSTEGMEL